MALDPYYQLGVARDATDAVIRKAYRKLASLHHPDKNPDAPHATARFQLIQEAYEILADKVRRNKFDRGEDSSGFDPQAAARGMLAGAYIEVLRGTGEYNTVRVLHELLASRARKQRSSQRAAKDVHKRYAAAKKRFRYKGDGENLFEIALDHQIEKVLRDLEEMARVLATIEAAQKMLEEYEDIEDLQTGLITGPEVGNFINFIRG